MAKRMPFPERFWVKVDKSGGPDACWPWTSAISEAGYGVFTLNRKTQYAHRLAYTLSVGPIPDEMDLDHTCHNRDLSCAGGDTCRHRRCQNWRHHDPVPGEVNIRRGGRGRQTHCKRGHPFDTDNTIRDPNGARRCRTCRDARNAKRHADPKPRRQRALLTHCRRGHEFTPANIYWQSNVRTCKTCRLLTSARATERRRQAKNVA